MQCGGRCNALRLGSQPRCPRFQRMSAPQSGIPPTSCGDAASSHAQRYRLCKSCRPKATQHPRCCPTGREPTLWSHRHCHNGGTACCLDLERERLKIYTGMEPKLECCIEDKMLHRKITEICHLLVQGPRSTASMNHSCLLKSPEVAWQPGILYLCRV